MKYLREQIDIDYKPILLSRADLLMITDSLIGALWIDNEQAALLVRRLVAEYREPSRQLTTIAELALRMVS